MKKKIMSAIALVMALTMTACSSSQTPSSSAAASDVVSSDAVASDTADSSAAASDTTAGGQTAAGKEGGTSLKFTTGGDQGTYYAFGGVLAGKISEVTSTNVNAITSGGSQANIEALQMGDAQIAFSQSDVLAYAYNGTRLFEEDGAVTDIRVLCDLYTEQVQIVTLNPDNKSVADLAGKNVSIGDQGSGVYFNAIDVLAAYDLTEDDIKPSYQSFGNSVEALQDGKIDAAFITAGAPTTAVTSLATTKQIYLISLDKEHIDKLMADSPYYSEYTIGKDVYATEEDTTTVAVGAVVIAAADLSDADAYNVLCGIYENIDTIKAAHAKGEELNLEFAASVEGVPYHAGAAEYFAEKGITVPTE